jgi:hypothetical protein
MFWKFWEHEKTKAGEVRLPGPKGIPVYVARHLVVEEKKDSNWVWKLKAVVRPTEEKDAFYCRVFDEAKAAQAGVQVKNWSSLDEHLDLILWEGYFDKEKATVRTEKFAKP